MVIYTRCSQLCILLSEKTVGTSRFRLSLRMPKPCCLKAFSFAFHSPTIRVISCFLSLFDLLIEHLNLAVMLVGVGGVYLNNVDIHRSYRQLKQHNISYTVIQIFIEYITPFLYDLDVYISQFSEQKVGHLVSHTPINCIVL